MKREWDLDKLRRRIGLSEEQTAEVLNWGYNLWLKEHNLPASQENMVSFILDLETKGWLPGKDRECAS